MDDRAAIGEAAGNLLAELNAARDDWKQNKISTDRYLYRVRVIRSRGRKFCGKVIVMQPSVVQKSLSAIAEEWKALVDVAEVLKEERC